MTPEAYHCAILSDGELAELRRIDRCRPTRTGARRSIAGEIELEQGTIDGPDRRCTSTARRRASRRTAIDRCSTATASRSSGCARANPRSAPRSSVSSRRRSTTDEKNRICRPIVPPTVPLDWLRVIAVELDNRRAGPTIPQLDDWMAGTRLDPFTKTARERIGRRRRGHRQFQRYLANAGAGEGQARPAPAAELESARSKRWTSCWSTTATSRCGSR